MEKCLSFFPKFSAFISTIVNDKNSIFSRELVVRKSYDLNTTQQTNLVIYCPYTKGTEQNFMWEKQRESAGLEQAGILFVSLACARSCGF